MKTWANERGSVAVETTISMSFASVLVGVALITVYLSFAQVWLNREVYEAVICLSTSAAQNLCEERLRQSTGQALPAGQVADLHLSRTKQSAEVHFSFKLAGRKIFEFKDSRKLPLLAASSPLDKL